MRKPRAHGNPAFGVLAAILACTSIFPALVQAALPAENADDWTLRKETDNIKVYTIDQDDSSFQAFKAEALMDTSMENLMAVMVNPKSCVEWVHNCTQSHAFGDGHFHDRYAYSVNNMPWPVADRDYVLRIRTQGEQTTGEVVMELNAVPDRREEVDGLVRVDRSDTLYRFIPEGDKTRMVWIQHTEPNGAIPGWLVNTLLVDIPVKSMEQLERVTRKERYQDHTLVYGDEGKLIDVVPSAQSGDD
ncbi:START domain-containing protein [uncultured Marinobacter sp.]|uniref:START domain-containing protein n=1 Tax=uncultured Marinobacter sp. TaxID=187379 RepID=UPI00261C9913|nr:START domain-containing protein [uncultured Marinobacter sp.]